MDTHPLTDPRVETIPVEECGETLVDARDAAPLATDSRLRGYPGSSTLVRSTVLDRLVTAQSLLPRGLRLLTIEGYRTARRQREHFEECLAALTAAHPDWPAARVRQEAGWHCSPSGTAPHRTGAAADVSLCDPAGVELDLGGPVHAVPQVAEPGSATQAGANRRILSDAMSRAGFVQLPTAWWHWSFGDPYWALVTGARAAIYGPLERESE